jgi:hypothetical protein
LPEDGSYTKKATHPLRLFYGGYGGHSLEWFFGVILSLLILGGLAGCAASEASISKAQSVYLTALRADRAALVAATVALQNGRITAETARARLDDEQRAFRAQSGVFSISGAPISLEVQNALEGERAAREALEQALRSVP